MRKKIRYLFYIVSFLFFLTQIISVENNVYEFYILIIYTFLLLSYMIYETKQLALYDKIKQTPFFINRLFLLSIYAILLISLIIYLKWDWF